VLDLQELHHLIHSSLDLCAGHTLRLEGKRDVLLDRHMRIERKELKDVRDIALAGMHPRDILSIQQNPPSCNRL
jgi:hypothetical protein